MSLRIGVAAFAGFYLVACELARQPVAISVVILIGVVLACDVAQEWLHLRGDELTAAEVRAQQEASVAKTVGGQLDTLRGDFDKFRIEVKSHMANARSR